MENITLLQISEAIGLLGIIAGALVSIFKFGYSYEKRIESLEARATALENEIEKNNKENTLILKGLLSCLKGLKEQGCNGPVTQSIEEINNYLIDNR